MKQVTLRIKDSKFKFFMELIKNLDFVQVDEGDSRATIAENIRTGLEEVKLAKQGKLKTTPAKAFLDEL